MFLGDGIYILTKLLALSVLNWRERRAAARAAAVAEVAAAAAGALPGTLPCPGEEEPAGAESDTARQLSPPLAEGAEGAALRKLSRSSVRGGEKGEQQGKGGQEARSDDESKNEAEPLLTKLQDRVFLKDSIPNWWACLSLLVAFRSCFLAGGSLELAKLMHGWVRSPAVRPAARATLNPCRDQTENGKPKKFPVRGTPIPRCVEIDCVMPSMRWSSALPAQGGRGGLPCVPDSGRGSGASALPARQVRLSGLSFTLASWGHPRVLERQRPWQRVGAPLPVFARPGLCTAGLRPARPLHARCSWPARMYQGVCL